MFPKDRYDQIYSRRAKEICRGCIVKKKCLDYALEFPASDMHGVWGGLTPRELIREQRRRGLKPVRPSIAQVWEQFRIFHENSGGS